MGLLLLPTATQHWHRIGAPCSTVRVQVMPLDQHNVKLLDNVHPLKWPLPPEMKKKKVLRGSAVAALCPWIKAN